MTSRSGLLVLCLLIVGVWFVYPVKHFSVPSDQGSYIYYAGQFADDPVRYLTRFESVPLPATPDTASTMYLSCFRVFSNRLGVVAPMGLSMRLFGSGRGVIVPQLLACLAIVCMIWYAAETERARWFSLLLTGSCAFLLEYSVNPLGDILLAAWLLGCFLLIRRRRFPVLAGALFVAAIVTKEQAVFAIPFGIGLAIHDAIKDERRLTYWVKFVAPPLAALVAFSPEWARRLEACLSNGPLSQAMYYSTHPGLHRFTIGPAVLILQCFGALVPLAVMAPGILKSYWLWYAVSILACWWFMPAEFDPYLPIPPMARHIIPVAPALIILAARNLDATLRS